MPWLQVSIPQLPMCWPLKSAAFSPSARSSTQVSGAPAQVGNYSHNKFGPRIGVAYPIESQDHHPRRLRIFWAPQIAAGAPISTLGYAVPPPAITGSLNSAGSPSRPWRIHSRMASFTDWQQLGTAAGLGQSFSLVDPECEVHIGSSNIHSISSASCHWHSFEVGYVGSHTTNLTLGTGNININALNPSYFAWVLQHSTRRSKSILRPGFLRYLVRVRPSLDINCCCPFSTYQTINLVFSSKQSRFLQLHGHQGSKDVSARD